MPGFVRLIEGRAPVPVTVNPFTDPAVTDPLHVYVVPAVRLVQVTAVLEDPEQIV
jgi:hypothetical protein